MTKHPVLIMDPDHERLAYELHKPKRIHYPSRPTVTKFIDDIWQTDLCDMQALVKWNKPFKYLLTVIDTFSRFAFARPLRNKTGPEVTQAFADILTRTKRTPKNLQSDQGREFFNKDFAKLMKENGINHYHTFGEFKAAFVERFNRTLKGIMYKDFTRRNSLHWVDYLSKYITRYNNSMHRSIQRKPVSVRKKHESNIRHLTILQHRKNRKKQARAFKSGDFVRISNKKSPFSKGYRPNWSEELFQIARVSRTFPRTYKLQDLKKERIDGSFYQEELQKTKIPMYARISKILKRKQKNNRTWLYVRWKGYDSRFDSWIPQNETKKL